MFTQQTVWCIHCVTAKPPRHTTQGTLITGVHTHVRFGQKLESHCYWARRRGFLSDVSRFKQGLTKRVRSRSKGSHRRSCVLCLTVELTCKYDRVDRTGSTCRQLRGENS